jgi:hypothetical protein
MDTPDSPVRQRLVLTASRCSDSAPDSDSPVYTGQSGVRLKFKPANCLLSGFPRSRGLLLRLPGPTVRGRTGQSGAPLGQQP